MDLTRFCVDHLADLEIIAGIAGWGLAMVTALAFAKVVGH